MKDIAVVIYYAIGVIFMYSHDYLGDFYERMFVRFHVSEKFGISLSRWKIFLTIVYFLLFWCLSAVYIYLFF